MGIDKASLSQDKFHKLKTDFSCNHCVFLCHVTSFVHFMQLHSKYTVGGRSDITFWDRKINTIIEHRFNAAVYIITR